ncbi:MAG: hypothetical protein PHC97_00285 [Patescibacteria group bacterium]|nr:hypothetical protein [Patescibacteria group bacterium]
MKLRYKSKAFLKGLIVFIAVSFFMLSQIVSVIFYNKPAQSLLVDFVLAIIGSIIIAEIVLNLIGKKEKQLDKEVEQLIDAYQYIGNVNRKIDSLLEMDISYLDHSKNHSKNETAMDIFRRLASLLSPEYGCLNLTEPFNLKYCIGTKNNNELGRPVEILKNVNGSTFKYSERTEDQEYFKEQFGDNVLKKYSFLIKPVYMHDKDIGFMFLIFRKNQRLEERDFNIIKIFSFYIALNYTFKPDFSMLK